MKKVMLVWLLLIATQQLFAQEHSLVKKWETDSLLKIPESVLFDAKKKVLYVSNIDGAPWEKDGKGSIGKVGTDGRLLSIEWVTGLNAPKGMGLYKNLLYVADLTEVVVIDTKKAQIVKRIPVEGATGLNDVSISKTGTVYVTDSKKLKVHRIENGLVSTVLENLQGPNGVLALEDVLLVLDRGSLLQMTMSGQVSKIADGMDPGTDGIEQVKENEYIVSCWGGAVYYVFANGTKQLMLDTRAQKINSADIGYDAKKRIVYVPTFYRKSVAAYEVK